MKTYFKSLLFLLLIIVSVPVIAQNAGEQLPVDPSIRIGKLKNGLISKLRTGLTLGITN